MDTPETKPKMIQVKFKRAQSSPLFGDQEENDLLWMTPDVAETLENRGIVEKIKPKIKKVKDE